MNLFFDLFNDDPHFFTLLCILLGAFLFGIFYFHEADKEYERQAASEWEEIANTFSDLTRIADIPTVMRVEHASKQDRL
ncbi:hypothetical protein [Herbaspirillum sp. RV1423]|uniref:hypothetical protein n=1 Tax=Herbaspirillum sp. RV1423 TaxID=1443993 RepID=UPI0004B416DC|nr:hypothetical protein [Herbaspirillum sp. RV1423]